MLTLIIGGRNSGKYNYLLEMGFNVDDIGADFEKKAIYKLNQIVKKQLEENIDPVEFIKNKIDYIENTVIVCDEVGCGVVHIDKFERKYIEAVGRVCCVIAKRADVVERMYCGINTRIKG